MGRLEPGRSLDIMLEQLASNVFDPQLAALGLGANQIEAQGLEELESSLERVNDAIKHPESFTTFQAKVDARVGLVLVTSGSEGHVTVGVLPLLLQRKKLILERIKTLRPQEQLVSIRQDVADNLVDGDLKEQVLHLIDSRLAGELKLTQRLKRESETVDRQAAARAAQMRLDVELKAQRSEIYKSLLERETVAGVVGPVLLFLFAVALIAAMFLRTPISSAVSDGFLLVLGYFFGQTTSRKPKRPKKK